MSKGHTPGPWDGRQEYNDHRDEIIARGRVVAIIPVRKTTGVMSDEKRLESDQEGEANARLIAAAPELLEALTIAREYALADAEPDDLAFIDAAIAKATGGTP